MPDQRAEQAVGDAAIVTAVALAAPLVEDAVTLAVELGAPTVGLGVNQGEHARQPLLREARLRDRRDEALRVGDRYEDDYEASMGPRRRPEGKRLGG